MDNKLYDNKLIDIFAAVGDIFITVAVVYICMLFAGSVSNGVLLLHAAMTFFVFNLYEVYKKTIRRKYDLILITSLTSALSTIVSVMASLLFPEIFKRYGILMYLIEMILQIAALSCAKMLFSYVIIKLEGSPKLLVLETVREENKLARKIKYSYSVLYEAWYDLIDDENEDEIENVIKNRMKEFHSIFVSPHIKGEVRYRFISEALKLKKEIYVLPDIYNISTLRSKMVQFDDTPALLIRPLSLTRVQTLIKRVFDICLSLPLVIITSPLMLLSAIAIKLDSKGPIIYRQERLTIGQKPFNIYKFRTMVNDAEKNTGAIFATEDDPRITRVGRFLRLTRLDELPQLFNILFGHMSIVGPRPERKIFVDEFLKTVDNYDKRYFVKAGLTGLAQVYGKYQTRVEDKILYDIMYIREFSFLLDIKIIFLTVKVMFIKESSSGISAEKSYDSESTSMKS